MFISTWPNISMELKFLIKINYFMCLFNSLDYLKCKAT